MALLVFAFTTLIPRSARADYPAAVLADTPTGYWRLNEPALYPTMATNLGSLAAAGNGMILNGPALGQAGALAGDADTAYSFTQAQSTKVDVPFNVALNPATFTVECWAKVTGGTSHRSPVTSRESSPQRGYILYATPGNAWEFWVGTGSAWASAAGGPVTLNAWVHLVGSYDGTTMRFYTNGVLASSRAVAFAPNASSVLRIGGGQSEDAGNLFFQGGVDEVAVYGGPLSDADILAHFQAGTGGGNYEAVVRANAPVGYWRLGEMSWSPSPVMATNLGSAGTTGDGLFTNYVALGQPGALVSGDDTAAGFPNVFQRARVEIPWQASFNNASAYSVECWAQLAAGNANLYRSPVSSRATAGGTFGYIFYATPAGNWEFWNGRGAPAGWHTMNGGPAATNVWTHLVGTWDGTNKSFYVNGQLVAWTNAGVLFGPNTNRLLRIGAGENENPAGNFFFKGGVDEVAVYDKALSPERVAAHFVAARGTNPAPVLPVIVQQPVGVTDYEGVTMRLSVGALGSVPFQYKWYFFGAEIPGGTNATLVLENVTSVEHSGTYYVDVSNEAGTVSSAYVEVNVLDPIWPQINAPPQSLAVYPGGEAVFRVAASGSYLMNFQWQHDDADIPDATNATFRVSNVQATNAGTYRVIVSNRVGTTNAEATLTLRAPGPDTYESVVVADGPVAYWRLNETAGPTAYDGFGAHSGGYSNTVQYGVSGALTGDTDTAVRFDGATGTKVDVPYSPRLNPATFTIECWAKVTGGSSHRSPLTSRADSPTRGYIFYATPANTWEFWNGTGGPAGSWNMMPGPAVVNDQWTHLVGTYDGATKRFYVNGVLVNTATVAFMPNPIHPLRIGAGASDSVVGNFFFVGDVDEVAVYDKTLTADQISTHYYAALPTPPLIVTQPQGTNVYEGATVTLSVTAAGTMPLSYQWLFFGTVLPGQTNRTLVLSNLTEWESGSYTVEVSNRLGGPISSAEAELVVLPTQPPTVTADPQPVTVYQGGTARFEVSATGGIRLGYQWRRNGVDLEDATNSVLTLTNVDSSLAGDYRVEVSNPVGNALSAVATLTVLVPASNSYPAVVLADRPSAYWRLNEANGPLAFDALGVHHGGYSNSVTFGVPGVLVGDSDPAVHFDGQVAKVDVPYSAALNKPANWSIEAWARVTGGDGSYRSPLTSRDDGPQRGYIFYATMGNLWEFWSGQGQQIGWDTVVGPPVVNNAWTHLVATYDGVTKTFYVNGVVAGTSTLPYAPNSDKTLRIGGGATDSVAGNFFFVGDVDEVAVYDQALSATQVATHYGARVSGPVSLGWASGGPGVLVLSWSVGTLESAAAVTGPWNPVPGAVSPWLVSTASGTQFYRVRVN